MRKEYESLLDKLAESKREALRELNEMFEAKIEEKELVFQEVRACVLCDTSIGFRSW